MAHHQLSVYEKGGTLYAVILIMYNDANLGSTTHGLITIDLDNNGRLVQLEGSSLYYFSFYERLGTLSTNYGETVHKFQYVRNGPNQWSANGLNYFVDRTG
jgi:hypothetical protein